ncbi:MAG: LPXTG cell wall anchor domain-containing protein, partial [Clostridia bacterium]|nr:LPXTG cell wall anchor domain-containing protein [Clostridia bacterium]
EGFESVEYENTEDGFKSVSEGFNPVYLVAAYLESKAGTTALDNFEVTNTDEVFEEGTVVHVDVIKLSDADQDLLDTVQEVTDEFQEEFEAGLTPAELAKNDYSYSTVAIYDVYALKDLAEVQPNGKVKMSIPAPALTAFETGKLFHIHDDGTKEEVEYTVNGNRWEFELDGFSNLVIVKVTAEPVTNPYTGDTLVVYIGLAVISMIALAGCAVLFVKKRKNNA